MDFSNFSSNVNTVIVYDGVQNGLKISVSRNYHDIRLTYRNFQQFFPCQDPSFIQNYHKSPNMRLACFCRVLRQYTTTKRKQIGGAWFAVQV